MSDDLVKQSIAELQEIVHCDCGSAYLERGRHSHACLHYMADVLKIVTDRIEELEAANRGLVRLNEATEARAKTAEAKLETAVEALTQIERAYYQEATNPSPETVRRMAARMNGIARDTQNALAELTGGKDE